MSKENCNQPDNTVAELQKRYAAGERDFKKAKLARANLSSTDLTGANLQGADLRKANLKDAKLKDVNLKESDLRGANLSAADLKGANLSGAYLELSILQKTQLQGADLRGANLSGTMLTEANLEKADLTFADLSDIYTIAQGGSGGASLEKANLRGANLKGANLKAADLRGADLRGTELKGAYPQGAYYDQNTNFPAGFDPVSTGMQKSLTSSKTSSSSAQGLKATIGKLLGTRSPFFIGALAAVVIIVAPLVIVQTWGEAKKSKPTPTSTAEPEIKVSFEANKPEAELEIKVSEANKPEAELEIKVSEDNKPAIEAETEVSEDNKPKSPPTSDVQRKTQAALAAPPPSVTPTRGSQVASCPVLVRVINAANPDKPSAVDVSVNGKKVISNVPFTQASRYVSVSPGKLRVQIMKAGTKTMVDERTFAAASNSAYSVAVTGPLSGPPGQLLFNKSPFVILEELSPPHPGKFKGGWYKLSETKAATDLRITKSGAPNVDEARLVDLIPKTGVDYPELNAGTYNFNPVLPNKSEPLVNSAYNPPLRVEIAKAKIPAGTIFDVFAIGNTLGKGHNSLKLSAAFYKTLPPTTSGCTRVL